ncbi:hypothetical protein A8B75_18270 [Sphingomonadales bacterium EhC05]|nr:hypothetical protein A8B75_18270 [Sphingomonadales bacterium EhC05]
MLVIILATHPCLQAILASVARHRQSARFHGFAAHDVDQHNTGYQLIFPARSSGLTQIFSRDPL